MVKARNETTERGVLTSWRQQREGVVKTRKETDRVRRALTSWRWKREGLVRTQKEAERPRRTHNSLETVEGGTLS